MATSLCCYTDIFISCLKQAVLLQVARDLMHYPIRLLVTGHFVGTQGPAGR